MTSNTSQIYKPFCYTHLSENERIKIEAWREDNITQKEIAKRLNRSQSTISRELRRNQPLKNTVAYNGKRSHERSVKRRSNASKRGRISDTILRECVISLLQVHYSPEAISGFLKKNTT